MQDISTTFKIKDINEKINVFKNNPYINIFLDWKFVFFDTK